MGSWLGATNRSISAAVAAALVGSGAMADASDSIYGTGSGGSGAAVPIGMNIAPIQFYSSEQPYLNILKSGGSGSAASFYTGWVTATTPFGTDTNEEGVLPLDADGYPTTLTGSSVGATFTSVYCAMNFGIGAVTGVTYPYGYAGISYTVQWSGAGTVQISGDATATLTSSGQTFTVATPASGLRLAITATGSGSNYLKNLSVVETAYVSSFNAGAIFHPKFLATIPSYSVLRTMDRQATNGFAFYPGELTPFSTSSGTIAQGVQNAQLASVWPYPTQTRNVYFNDGTVKSCSFTYNNAYFSWTGGLPNALTTTFAGQACYCNFWISWQDTWSQRSLPSNCFWSLATGEPLEVIIALCNQVGAHPWITLPLTAPDSYITSVHQLIYSGTGMQSGYSPLSSSLNLYAEISNEVWNSQFNQYDLAGSLGAQVWPGQASDNGPSSGNFGWNRNYYGLRSAIASELAYSVWGSSFSRCIPVMTSNCSDTSYSSASLALATSYWTSAVDGYTGPASAHHVKALAVAPYWMESYPSSGDVSTMTSQSDGGLNYFFQAMTSNVMTGGSSPGALSSAVPSNGWLGQQESCISGYVGFLSAHYPTLNLLAYEGGPNMLGGGSPPTGWVTLAETAMVDSRMGTQMYNYLHYWLSNVGTTASNINCVYTNCTPRSSKSWGVLESCQQTLSPQSSAPPKWAQIQNVIAGN